MLCRVMKKLLLLFLLLATVPVLAQTGHPRSHSHAGSDDDDADDTDDDADHLDFHESKKDKVRMSSAFSLYLPMPRNGSGTGWLPDATPVYGTMIHTSSWVFMFQGDIFTRYTATDMNGSGTRGASKTDAPNMIMFMGQRKIGDYGLFRFSSMFSADPFTIGSEGYPLLFQTGETYKGQPLVDRQHPHDLFSELSVGYTQAFSTRTDVYVNIGYPGEPALGPTAFMHRPSGMFNPDAPLGHHWQDATHIAWGVGTLGVRHGRFKLEGSLFNGREPDEQRNNFEKFALDSWSGRLSYNPNYNWSLQVSHGILKEPETLHPGEDVARTTASAVYARQYAYKRYFTASIVAGQNSTAHATTSSALAEATLRLHNLILHGRAEWVQKSAEELALVTFAATDKFDVGALTLGASYDIFTLHPISMAIGGQVTANVASEKLQPIYGELPLSGQIFLHIYPALMRSR